MISTTRTISSCWNGCGSTDNNDESQNTKRCSKCKLARYCSRACQVEHWPAHKHECYTPEDNAQTTFVCLIPPTDLPIPDASKLQRKYMGNNVGNVVILGRNRTHPKISEPWMVVTDVKETVSDERLFLPKVPTMILSVSTTPSDNEPQQKLLAQATKQGLLQKCLDVNYAPHSCDPNLQHVLTTSFFDNAFEMLFCDETLDAQDRVSITGFISAAAAPFQWSSTVRLPFDNQWKKDVGKRILEGEKILLGGGIEMIYITPPGICFAELTKSELAYQSKMKLTGQVLRMPMAVFRCVQEGWYVFRINHRLHSYPLVNTSPSPDVSDSWFLKIFVASAEIGDIATFISCWMPAKRGAIYAKQEDVFLDAAEKFLPHLKGIYPHYKQQIAFYMYEIGLVYELIASRLIKKSTSDGSDAVRSILISAALAYKKAADLTLQYYPSLGQRELYFQALAATLVRLEENDMATRAYMWALTDPLAYTSKTGTQIGNTMQDVWARSFMTVKERKRNDAACLKQLRSTAKRQDKMHGVTCCHRCGGKVLESGVSQTRCSRCFVPYCSRACQKDDWPQHKGVCTERVDPSFGSSMEDFAHCPDETRSFLDGCESINRSFTMSLSDWSVSYDKFKVTIPQGGQPINITTAMRPEVRSKLLSQS